MAKKIKRLNDIPHSKSIELIEKSPTQAEIHVSSPAHNMQTDAACFEGLAMLIRAKLPAYTSVSICFRPLTPKWNGLFDDKIGMGGKKVPANKRLTDYMRFLYRVWRFTTVYSSWAHIGDENSKNEVNRFEQALTKKANENALLNNVPTSDSTFKMGKGKEHQFEKWFAGSAAIPTHLAPNTQYLNEIFQGRKPNGEKLVVDKLFDQFPNGLFWDRVDNKHRIFPTGYFDLWGVTPEDDLCLFELKKEKDNAKLGIISELFFYAMYLRDFVCGGFSSAAKCPGKIYRGYDSMLKAAQKGDTAAIHAAFLVAGCKSGLHATLLDENTRTDVLRLLNDNQLNIHYSFAFYDEARVNAGIESIKPYSK